MEEEIRNYIASELIRDGASLNSAEDPIFTSGLVDSFGMVKLVTFLYERFGVDIDPATVDIRQMNTSSQIAALVSQRR